MKLSFSSSAAFGFGLVISAALSMPTFAAPKVESLVVSGKTYYKVVSGDTQRNTGNKVCALVGATCLGYTNLGSNNVCRAFHPTAKSIGSVKGSKAGFYCDGSPQRGPSCEKNTNTCAVCPTCKVNVDCTTDISLQFREMYVECSPVPSRTSSSASSKKSSSSSARSVTRASSSSSKKSSTPVMKSVNGVGPFPGNIACDFYQTKKKFVSCAAYQAADTFCRIAMQSRFAKAAECNENGRIICTKPCVTNPPEPTIARCAYDPERRSGYEVPPYNFCTK